MRNAVNIDSADMANQKFSVKFDFTDRKSKALYIFKKYEDILQGKILDVGADAMHLKPLLSENGIQYKGIGYGMNIDEKCDLEIVPYGFKDQEFDTVLCFDVLEHLENIHLAIEELFRISKDYVIISLPNPWAEFFQVLLKGDYGDKESLKFYGLPIEKPSDRHRWFFSEMEARRFVDFYAKKCGFHVVQVDSKNEGQPLGGNSIKGILARKLFSVMFRKDICDIGLHHGSSWFVCRRNS